MSLLKRMVNYDNPRSLGARFRQKRSATVKALIRKISQQHGSCCILDIGGEGQYWKQFETDFLRENSVHVTISNLEYEPGMDINPNPVHFTIERADGCNLPHPDNSFHFVHSNSVIEHVGDWPNMMAFASQIRRLAPRYYVQTPHFWFPYEPHFGAPFFHWLPEPVRISLLLRRHMGHFPPADSVSQAVEWAQSARLLDRTQFNFLFPDAAVVSERFAGMTKSLIAIRDEPDQGH